MSININGTEFTTFDDLWNHIDSLTDAEKEEIKQKVTAAGKHIQNQDNGQIKPPSVSAKE